jgi:hypothetical protein
MSNFWFPYVDDFSLGLRLALLFIEVICTNTRSDLVYIESVSTLDKMASAYVKLRGALCLLVG